MRTLLLGIVLASATAAAAPASPPLAPAVLSPVVVDDLPQLCRDFGTLANSPIPGQALSARISLATCMVDQKVKTLTLCDCEQSVNDVDAALAPSMTMLDEVFAAGDAAMKILARQAQADLLDSLARRLLATVPPPLDPSESAVAMHELRMQMLGPLVNPMFMRARSAYTEVDRLARENPQLAKNQAVLMAVRSCRAKLAQDSTGVARR